MAKKSNAFYNSFEEGELSDIFEYLDRLRDSGVTNMYGSPAYLQKTFLMDKEMSYEVFKAWCDTFDGESGAKARAEIALIDWDK